MRTTLLTALLLSASPHAAAQSSATQTTAPPPYLDASLPVDRRVRDLLGRMTPEEKVGQITQIDVTRLMGRTQWDRGPLNPEWLDRVLARRHVGSVLSGGGSAPVPNTPEAWARMTNDLQRFTLKHSRLGIPLVYGTDAVHGHNNVVGATIFPHNLGLAATFDPSLARVSAQITARALRATGVHWNFAPDADVGRDGRWGRFYETWGEDPLLASRMVEASVRGLQGERLGPQGVAATVKHFAAYGAPLGGKDRADARVTDAELRAVHLPPFQAGFSAGAATVMVNSGSVNGVPAHASRELLTDVLRRELGFEGVAVSDWEDVRKLQTVHRVAPTYREAVRLALTAGVDVSMVPHDADSFADAVLDLVRAGEVPQTRLDEAAGRVLALKFRLGLFERPLVDPALADAAVRAGADVAARAARASITLVQTDGRTLPLGREAPRVLVVGERARDPRSQLGGWTVGWQGLPQNEDTPAVTVLEGMKAVVPAETRLRFSPSVPDTPDADVVVAVVGEPPHAEGEADNPTLALPAPDVALLREAVATGRPVVAVLLAGRPLVLPEDVRGKLAALVMAYLPGSEGGRAVADVLYGNTNPGGRLPFAWPRSASDLPAPYDAPRAGRPPLYPFGHGLSYTTFAYGDLRAEGGRVTVNVTNTGRRAGAHSVLAFARPDAATPARLAAFGRVTLRPGETARLTLSPALPAGRAAEIAVGDLRVRP